MGHTMETVASKCLLEKKSRSFRSAIPKLNATIWNNPSKTQLSQKVWQLWDMETVASKCLLEKKSRSFRGATPKLNATFVSNPRKFMLSQKIWQLWDIQWKQWPQSAYVRKNLEASEVLPPSWTQHLWTIQVRPSYHRRYGSYGTYNGNSGLKVLVREKI